MPSEDIIVNSQAKALLVSAEPIVDVAQPYLKLNDGTKMPMLGIGTWNAQGKQLKDAIKIAIKYGYRHIDTATNYRNESIVGEAIAESIADGLCKRSDLFITTKLWNNSHKRESVPKALEKSLKELKMNYVDLYLIHYPIAYEEGDVLSPLDSNGKPKTTNYDYVQTWLGMEDAKRAGLTRSIGVSNFNIEQLTRILSYDYNGPRVVPSINQIECHPYLSQDSLICYCKANGIQLTAYSPLGSPGRCESDSLRIVDDEVVKSLSRKYLRPAAQILIAYQLKRDLAVIPKAIQSSHITSNIDALTLNLSKEDVELLNKLDKNMRFQKFERCSDHIYYPFNN